MNKQKVITTLSKISELKKNTGLQIIDTHVHPLDVMGVVHYTDVKKEYKKIDYLTPSILEKFNYGKVAQIGSRLFCKFLPEGTNRMIKSSYESVIEKSILNEMNSALVDSAVMLPVDPWLPTEIVGGRFFSERLFTLGSVDIHNIKIEEIGPYLTSIKEKYNIVGIKLHPNLQNFKPQPSQNPSEIGEKLHHIYKFAEKENLYILFHGGISFYTDFTNPKYKGDISRSRVNAILKNFCDYNGKSELFERYSVPIVIAHLGHYGIVNPDYKLMEIIVKKFNNVHFDTAGVSPSFIKNTLNLIPSSKIIFGSDAIYNRMAYNLAFIYLASESVRSGEKKEKIISNILQKNYLSITSV